MCNEARQSRILITAVIALHVVARDPNRGGQSGCPPISL
jgi:hypothetical protein